MSKGKWKANRVGAATDRSVVLKGLFSGRIRRALDPETRLRAHVRTLEDMSEEEIQALEADYNCPIHRPGTTKE